MALIRNNQTGELEDDGHSPDEGFHFGPVKVWLVVGNYNYMSHDGEYVEAIYATPEAAEAAVQVLRDEDECGTYRVYWEEVLS